MTLTYLARRPSLPIFSLFPHQQPRLHQQKISLPRHLFPFQYTKVFSRSFRSVLLPAPSAFERKSLLATGTTTSRSQHLLLRFVAKRAPVTAAYTTTRAIRFYTRQGPSCQPVHTENCLGAQLNIGNSFWLALTLTLKICCEKFAPLCSTARCRCRRSIEHSQRSSFVFTTR